MFELAPLVPQVSSEQCVGTQMDATHTVDLHHNWETLNLENKLSFLLFVLFFYILQENLPELCSVFPSSKCTNEYTTPSTTLINMTHRGLAQIHWIDLILDINTFKLVFSYWIILFVCLHTHWPLLLLPLIFCQSNPVIFFHYGYRNSHCRIFIFIIFDSFYFSADSTICSFIKTMFSFKIKNIFIISPLTSLSCFNIYVILGPILIVSFSFNYGYNTLCSILL